MMITKEEVISELKKYQIEHDTEYAHEMADDVLCRFLLSLGYKDVIEEYNKIDKWYA